MSTNAKGDLFSPRLYSLRANKPTNRVANNITAQQEKQINAALKEMARVKAIKSAFKGNSKAIRMYIKNGMTVAEAMADIKAGINRLSNKFNG